MKKKLTILDKANAIVYGDRETLYDHPNANFERIANRWATVFSHPVTTQQVAICMMDVKLSRLTHNPQHEDSLIDVAGYAACYERLNDPT